MDSVIIMDESMDVPPKPVRQEESRRDRRGAEDKRRERDATERRFEKEERAPRRTHTRSSPERLGVGDRKERDREYKRRQSTSPPPVNKDRRHSPSSGRSPPYKRRRDVVFEGSRRKSFGDEGGRGFANDNWIGGFDGAGLYLSKGMEDQNKSDYSNFQGFTMNSYSTITYGNSHISRRESFMTYKQFILDLEDDISPKEAQCRYEVYKKDYTKTKKRAYFKKHKNNDWLRDKYDPTRLEALLIRRNEDAKIQAKEFLSELQTCVLCLSADVKSSTKEEHDSDMDYRTKRIKLSQPHSLTQEYNDSLLVHSNCSILKRISNDIDIERSLIKKLDREKGIDKNVLLVGKDSEIDTIGIGPLVILSSCKLKSHVKELEGIEYLEIMRKYLWQVHFVDYYGMMEYKEKPKKNRLKGLPKVEINESSIENSTFIEWEKKLETTWQRRLQTGDLIESMLGKDKLQITISDALDPFVRKIRDEKYGWKYGCSVKGCTKLFHGAKFVHKHLKLKHLDLITEVITKAQEKLYFQNYMSDVDAPGTNYKVSMHLRHTHSSSDKSQKNHRHSLSKTSIDKQEYIDIHASSEKVHHPSDTKSNPYPTQECSRILENEHFNCDGQKEKPQLDLLEAPQHSPPPQIFPILGNVRPNILQRRHIGSCFEHLPMDPFMFDHFNGQPLQGLSNNMYMHDIPCPPQVLMPVPGAGPLGPFVPAPSRIAMSFLAEAPDPFHHGFGCEVFNNKEGPFTNPKIPTSNPLLESGLYNISSLMIPPHVLNQDPRSIRSYHDLDKPEDDVTVIDYRSL